MTTNHDDLIAKRSEEYGEAYQITDRWIKENLQALSASPSPFSLILIHNKLTRALTSPRKQDHYDDIIGYAKLLLRELEGAREEAVREDAMRGDLDPEVAVRRYRAQRRSEG